MIKLPNLPLVHLRPFAAVEDRRPALLVTSRLAWQAVQGDLRGLNVAVVLDVTEATTAHWDTLDAGRPSGCEVVYAVGGGLAADTAKYLAARHGLPLVVLPTALSVDAFITTASGIRQDGCVVYIETKVPEALILDLDTIAHAPLAVRAAGITDVLSIATGNWDWKFAHEHGRNPAHMPFIPWVSEAAQAILSGALDCAEAAGRGDHDGLKALYDCLALEVQLCNQIGHSRPEEGSEHYFAYAVENVLGHGLPHGDLVGPGIVQIARLQGQDTARLEQALAECHVPLDRIPQPVIAETLRALPAYCAHHGLAFGIAHILGATPADAAIQP